jgi:hypothetical protein
MTRKRRPCQRCTVRTTLDLARVMGDIEVRPADGQYLVRRASGKEVALWLCHAHADGIHARPVER